MIISNFIRKKETGPVVFYNRSVSRAKQVAVMCTTRPHIRALSRPRFNRHHGSRLIPRIIRKQWQKMSSYRRHTANLSPSNLATGLAKVQRDAKKSLTKLQIQLKEQPKFLLQYFMDLDI